MISPELLKQDLEQATKNYLKNNKKLTEQQIQDLKNCAAEIEKISIRFFKPNPKINQIKIDKGIQRATKLLGLLRLMRDTSTLEQWFTFFVTADEALGNSTKLRSKVYTTLTKQLDITQNEIDTAWDNAVRHSTAVFLISEEDVMRRLIKTKFTNLMKAQQSQVIEMQKMNDQTTPVAYNNDGITLFL